MLLISSQGIIICNKCGIQKKILVSTEKPSYRSSSSEVSYFAISYYGKKSNILKVKGNTLRKILRVLLKTQLLVNFLIGKISYNVRENPYSFNY